MKLSALPLLCDESIAAEVVERLRTEGFDAVVPDANACAGGDPAILAAAHRDHRVILTHDADFGTLAIHGGHPVYGIIYVRPGHINAKIVIRAIRTLFSQNPDVEPPFILVVDFDALHETVRIRYRSL